MRTPAMVLVIGLALAGGAAAQEFEVASIKPSPPNPPGLGSLGSLRLPPGQWRAMRMPLVTLIGTAYPEYAFEGRVIGGPGWVRDLDVIFDVNVRMDPKTTAAQMAPMMAKLLAERFALRTHVEQRPVDVYVLKMARTDGRLGAGLKRSGQACVDAKTAKQPAPPECRGVAPSGGLNLPTAEVAEFLRYLAFTKIDRPVIDRTGLTGYFEFQLSYDFGPFGQMSKLVTVRPIRPDGVSFFTALQEQAGLRLDAAREVMDVLVIDSAKLPDPD